MMNKPTKPKEIIELEKVYRVELTELTFDQYDKKNFREKENQFVLNPKEEVIALNLNRNQITEIKVCKLPQK